jgi:hypothetical protein
MKRPPTLTMKATSPFTTIIGISWFITTSLFAGQFKHITVDGDFEDWFGVPVADVDEMDADGEFDIKDVSIANDEDYLYIRIRLHGASNYADFNHQVLVDTDADGGTGHPWGGVGSELFVENGSSYQQKGGRFNEGAGSNLGWKVSPGGSQTQFEIQISRAASDAEGLAFFGSDEVAVSVLAQTLEWQLADSLEGVPYIFATQPEPFTGMKTIINLVDTFWFYQEVADPEPDWLLPDYSGDDTWKGGQGFFSYGFANGTFPVNASVQLATDRTTYYFRAPFLWENAAEGVALLMDAHFSDGAVIYLNGDEVRRIRMPEGEIDGNTQALSTAFSPGSVETFSLPAAALITGENLLMVELHQSADSTESLAFGLTLTASDSIPPSLEEPSKPEDQEIEEGQAVTFALGTIAGTEPYTFQWSKDAEVISEATGARLEIPIVLQEDAGTYTVDISNASGSVRSREVIFTTTALPVSFSDETLPTDQTLAQGKPITLSVEVLGSPNMTYQWYKDDAAIELGTEATYTIEAALLEDDGDYHVTVSNRVNSITSRQAKVTVQSDQDAPVVNEITAASGTILIAFSEPLDEASAIDSSHYTIPGIPVARAAIAEDLQTVTLETESMTFGQDYQITIDGVEDRFGNSLNTTVPIRATILIDGDFGDWAGIGPITADPSTNEGIEFNEFWAANDDKFLYLRFSFHKNIGQLPLDYLYQIFIDGDNDPTTGLAVSTIGSSLMIENGNGWLQTGGAFNEGSVPNVDFQLAPTGPSAEFECRIALGTDKDGTSLLTADTLGVSFNLISTSWEVIDSGPEEALLFTLSDSPIVIDPDPTEPIDPVTIVLLDGKIEILWNDGLLESSETLLPNSWAPVPDAASPYLLNPDGRTRFYRSTN